MHAVHQLTFLSLALMTGSEFCVAAFVEPVLRSLPEDVQIASVPRFASRLGRQMPPWYALNLILTAALATGSLRSGLPSRAVWVCLAAQLVVLAITLVLLVPRNNRLAKMSSPYPEWKLEATQWDSLHRLRVALLLLASCSLLL